MKKLLLLLTVSVAGLTATAQTNSAAMEAWNRVQANDNKEKAEREAQAVKSLEFVYPNIESKTTIDNMVESKSINDIKQLSNYIVLNSNKNYDFYKVKPVLNVSHENFQWVIYTPEGMTEEQKKEEDINNYKNCLVVKFSEWNKEENKDLENKGEKVYSFQSVTGSYLNLFGFWSKTFYPSSTKEEILQQYKFQEYRLNKNIKYKFRKDNDTWTISKSY